MTELSGKVKDHTTLTLALTVRPSEVWSTDHPGRKVVMLLTSTMNEKMK